jgi:GNAT superfamily N-acetyltransferase
MQRSTRTPATIREAGADDASVVAALLGELGYEMSADTAAERLAALSGSTGERVLLAFDGSAPSGLVAVHVAEMLHRPKPVARVTALVVAQCARGRGVGRVLLDHAVAFARERGCGLIELTSALYREDAHAFYRANGWASTAQRFHRVLE